jgi:chromatin remodeling complex protein RSC6
MPAQSKLVKPTKTTVPAPVVANSNLSVSEVPVVEKKTKKAAKAVSAAVEEVPVKGPEVVASSSTVPVAAAAVDSETSDVVADSADSHLVELSSKFYTKLAESHQIISSLKADFRALEKFYLREIKTAQKQSSKRKRKAGNRAPSGFVKPTRISDDLAAFLEKPIGSEMARTEVTREINKYIRTNNLQDKENGRKIIPDKKLSTLLVLTPEDHLTYFNLQRYMSKHFARATRDVTTA